jgi:hypothetical protein
LSGTVATRKGAPKRWRSWRRQILDQALVDTLAGYFRKGATVKIAAGRIGVPPGVLRMWITEGERQLTEIYGKDVGYPDQEGLLYHDCVKAFAEYLAEQVDTVSEPGDNEWRAAGWLLERRDEEFNPASKVEVSGPQGGPIEHEGHVIAGIVDLVAFAKDIGAGHFLGLDGGHPLGALPAAGEVLPDPVESLDTADAPAHVPGP